METKGIHIGEAVRFGWRTMKANLGFFIVLLIVAWLVEIVPWALGEYIIDRVLILGLFLYLLYLVVSIVVTMGLIKISIQFCDNVKGKVRDLFACFPFFFAYLFSSILYVLIIFGGLILLIFPGIIWAIKFGLYPYFIVDKGMGPIEALRASARATMGAKWDLFGFGFVISVISLIGFLCLMIGSFATVPTILVATALVYRQLLSQTKGLQPAIEATDVTR